MVVTTVAVPFMPGLRSRTVTCLPSTVKWKSGGTVSSRLPSASLMTTTLPSTETISKAFTCVVFDWAWTTPFARVSAAATTTTVPHVLQVARYIRFSFGPSPIDSARAAGGEEAGGSNR